MLKHAYHYHDYSVLILTSAGEILSADEYVISGLDELLEERLAADDEAFILDETLINTQVVPDVREGKKEELDSGMSRSMTSKS